VKLCGQRWEVGGWGVLISVVRLDPEQVIRVVLRRSR
jgi:hypothetical protein